MQNDYLIIGNCFIFEIIENKLHKSKNVLNMEINKKFKIYDNKTSLEASKAKFENYEWNFYDESGNKINIDDFRIAVTGGFDIKPIMYTIENYNNLDEKIIKELDEDVSEKGFKLYADRLKKIEFDFDDDGTKEKICTMSNFLFGEKGGKNYLFLEKSNTVTDKLIDFDTHLFHVIELLKIGKKTYVVVLKSLGDPITYKDDNLFIYTVQNNKIIECKFE